MLIILEGLDKCGKTTFAQNFAVDGTAIIKHSTKEDDAVDVLAKYAPLANERTVILDRSFLSEMTYGPVYRGEMRITPAKLMKITKLLHSTPHIILYFSRPENENKQYDSTDEFEKDTEKLKLVEKRYKDYIARYKNRFNIYEIQYK